MFKKILRISTKKINSLLKHQFLASLTAMPRYNFQDINNNNVGIAVAIIQFGPTYMSKFNLRNQSEVENYLRDRGLEFRIRSQEFAELKYCPVCPKPHNEDPSNLYKFSISTKTGQYQCFRGSCSAKGSWLDFKNFLNGRLNLQFQPNENQKHNKMDSHEFHPLLENVRQEKGSAYQYITGQDYTQGQRGLDRKVILEYQIGIGTETFNDTQSSLDVESVYFPMYRRRSNQEIEKLKKARIAEKAQDHLKDSSLIINDNKSDRYELVKCKVRGGSKETKHLQKVMPGQAMDGIFGLNTVPEDVEQVIITEGEFDAMAAYQVTGIPSISLPFGARNLPDYLVRWLDQYVNLKKIYLWLDEDEAGRLNAPKMAKKLGYQRCVTVRTSYLHLDGSYPKDANDALREFPDKIQLYLKNAKSEIAQNIIQFADIRETIYQRFLRADQSHGTQSSTLPIYNKTTKGLRNGELSIITGPTGSGKTTLLSQLSLDLCQKGVNTLWGSFEIKNERLLESMMLQFAKCELTKIAQEDPDKFNYVCQKFEEVPLYLMNFYGSTNIHAIIDTIEYAIHAFQVSHVCLDNLQFMLGNQQKGFMKFDFQDEVIEKFRRIATDHDIHLTLVIHPKKVDESEDLNIASVFGTAKATQEADNVFIIQNRGLLRLFDVKKNRYDGDTGRAPLAFDKKLKLYFQMTQNQAISVEENRLTVNQIIDDRERQNLHFQSILKDYKPLNGGGSNNNNNGDPNPNGDPNSNTNCSSTGTPDINPNGAPSDDNSNETQNSNPNGKENSGSIVSQTSDGISNGPSMGTSNINSNGSSNKSLDSTGSNSKKVNSVPNKNSEQEVQIFGENNAEFSGINNQYSISDQNVKINGDLNVKYKNEKSIQRGIIGSSDLDSKNKNQSSSFDLMDISNKVSHPEIQKESLASYVKKQPKTPTKVQPITPVDSQDELGLQIINQQGQYTDMSIYMNYDEPAEMTEDVLQQFGIDHTFSKPKKLNQQNRTFLHEKDDKGNLTFQKSKRVVVKQSFSEETSRPKYIKPLQEEKVTLNEANFTQKHYKAIQIEDNALDYDKKLDVKLLRDELVSFYLNNQAMELPSNIKSQPRK